MVSPDSAVWLHSGHSHDIKRVAQACVPTYSSLFLYVNLMSNPYGKPPIAPPVAGAYGGRPVEPKTSGQATTSLVLGLASLLCTIFTGIPAIILGALALGNIFKSNGRIGGKSMAIGGIVLGALGTIVFPVMVGIMLPAVQQVRVAARRTETLNHVREILIGMLNYESMHEKFPACKPPQGVKGSGLSWRVHLLPFLGHQHLYQQFDLDQPWDSPYNLALVDLMPACYTNPNVVLPPGKTTLVVPTSPADANSKDKTLFVDGEMGVSFGAITDGSANTVMLLDVDTSDAVTWTQPTDWEFDPQNPKRALGGNWQGLFLVGLADGSVRSINNDVSDREVVDLMTRSGGASPAPRR